MAAEEPPTNVPRIADVQNPATGHYVVMVRMPTQLATKYPDKPWGTAIESIGLARGESAKYPGYVLVDVEPLKGSPDMFWIFQKLDGPAWTTTSNSRESLTPQKYRGQTVVVKTEQEVDPGTAPTTLTGNLVASVVTQTPNTGKAVLTETTETIAGNTALPLVGSVMLSDGTLGTVTETLVETGGVNDSIIPSALHVDASVDPLGNGKSVKKVVTIPAIFDGKAVTVSKPDVIPAKFQAAVESVAIEETLSGTTASPTLASDEESRSEQRVDVFKIRRSTKRKPAITFPVSLNKGSQVDGEGILNSVVQTLDVGAQTITPSATVSGNVEDIGGGMTVKTQITKTEVFPSTTASHQQPGGIPPKFVLTEIRSSSVSAGTTATPDSLGTGGSGVTSASAQRVDAFRVKKDKSEQTILTTPLSGEEYGDIVTKTVTETLVADGTAADTGLDVTESVVDPIGNGKSIRRTKKVKGGAWPNPVEIETGISSQSVVPAKFARSIKRTRTTSKVAQLPTSPITIGATEVERSYKRETPDRLELSVTTEELVEPLPVLVGKIKTPEGQIATVTESLLSNSPILTTTQPTTLDDTVTPLGDGKFVRRTVAVDTLFANRRGSIESNDPVPAKFKSVVITTTNSATTEATYAAPSGLSAGEVSKQVDEITSETIRTTVTSRPATTNASLSGSQHTEHGIADVTETLSSTNTTAAEGFGVIDSSVSAVGGGLFVSSKTVISEFPILKGTEILPPHNIVVTTTKEIVEAGTEGSDDGDLIVEVKPWDKWHSIQITSRFDISRMDPTQVARDVRYQFPDVLEAVGLSVVITRTGDQYNGIVAAAPKIKHGPSGSFRGILTRTFSMGPPILDDEEIWQAQPESDSVIFAYILNGILLSDTRGTMNLPPTIHGNIGIQVTGAQSLSGEARFASTGDSFMSPTNKIDLPESGTEVLVNRDCERIRGNVWMLEKTHLIMP